jgi:hypothetical protein
MADEKINHPPHYTFGTIEVIDAIEDWGLAYHAGNVIKYVARHMHKGTPLDDLKKARWYLTRLIEKMEADIKKEESLSSKKTVTSRLMRAVMLAAPPKYPTPPKRRR